MVSYKADIEKRSNFGDVVRTLRTSGTLEEILHFQNKTRNLGNFGTLGTLESLGVPEDSKVPKVPEVPKVPKVPGVNFGIKENNFIKSSRSSQSS